MTRGVLSADDLREALLQHTVESLGHLCSTDTRASWVPRSGKTYSPRFTFATTELLAHVGAAAHEGVAARVRPVLARSFAEDEWAAAFVRSQASAFPVPVALHGAAPRSATMLVRFGKWAASALDVAAAFSDEAAFLAVSRSSGPQASSLVAFRHGDAVVAGETGAHGPARIMNRRAQQRRSQGPDADL